MTRSSRHRRKTAPLGRVSGIFRYPVKSMRGEVLPRANFDARGMHGDRDWAVTFDDGRVGSGKSWQHLRRLPGLLNYSTLTTDAGVLVRNPEGRQYIAGDPRLDAELSETAGRPVSIQTEGEVQHFDCAGVHLLSNQSIEELAQFCDPDLLAPQRFRPNLLLDLFSGPKNERELVGRRFAIGRSLVLQVQETTERCSMVTHRNHPLPEAKEILRQLADRFGLHLGLYASVEEPGSVVVGDLFQSCDLP